MRPGNLTEPISVRYSTEEFDPESGTNVKVWHTRFDLWADVEFMSGDIRAIDTAEWAQRDYRMTVRRVDGIKESDTVVWREKAHAIRAIGDEGPRSPHMVIEVQFGTGDAGAT